MKNGAANVVAGRKTAPATEIPGFADVTLAILARNAKTGRSGDPAFAT